MGSGGGSTSSTNVSIPPEQWFEAIAREQLSQNAYNKAQQGQNYWNMANQMAGIPAVNYNNPYPATPTGPFEWTHDQNQGSSWGRGWDGKDLAAPSFFQAQGQSATPGAFQGSASYARGGASVPNTGYVPSRETGAQYIGRSDGGPSTGSVRYGIGPDGQRHPRDTGKNPTWNTSPAIRPETPAWQERMNVGLMQDFGQGLLGMDASLGRANTALGNQGGSLNAATGAFNKAGGYFDQASGAFNAGNQYAGQAASAAQGSQKFFDKAAGSADKMAAPISKLGALGDEMQNTLLQGKLPDSYQENWIKGNQRGFDEMMGSNLNSLASRGVINSSVANRSLGEVNDRINESYARNFLDSMASQRANFDSTAGKYTDQLGGLGQQANAYQGAGQGYIGSANALSTAGQTANASGQGMMGAGQGYLGVGQGHLGTASGWGDTFQNSLTNAQASMLPYQTRFSGMKEMMGVGNTMDDDLRNLYAQWRGNRYQVPGDTIVSQGK